MITDDELNRYRDHRGRLPDVSELTARIRAAHPEWNLIDVYEYGRQLYMASAARTEAKAAAIRAETRDIHARTAHLSARRAEKQPVSQYAKIARDAGMSVEWVEGHEPDAYFLLIGRTDEAAHIVNPDGAKLHTRLAHQVRRIRARFNREARERGKDCVVCGEHFKPRKIDQVRCGECIRGSKKFGGDR